MQRAMREGWRKRVLLAEEALAKVEAEAEAKAISKSMNELAPWIEEQKTKFIKRSFAVANSGIGRIRTFQRSNKASDPRNEANTAKAAESWSRVGREALGLTNGSPASGPIQVNVLTNRSAVQIISPDSLD